MQTVNVANRNRIGSYLFVYKWLLLHYLLIILWNQVTDRVIQYLNAHPPANLLWVNLLDTCCHAVTAGLLWSSIEQKVFYDENVDLERIFSLRNWIKVFFVDNREYTFHVFLAFMIGALVDIDHFIAAKSLSLDAARNLSSRPFGQAVAFIVAVELVCRFLLNLNPQIRLLIVTSLSSHQLRDSIRRGLWLWPVGSTPPIPRNFVFLIFIVISLLSRHFLYSPSEEQDLHY